MLVFQQQKALLSVLCEIFLLLRCCRADVSVTSPTKLDDKPYAAEEISPFSVTVSLNLKRN